MFPPVLLLAAVAVGTVPGAAALASARWPYRSPAVAILLWQALGLSWGLAAVGALAGLGAVPARWGVAGGALSGAVRALRDAALGFSLAALVAVARLVFLTAGAALFDPRLGPGAVADRKARRATGGLPRNLAGWRLPGGHR